MRTAKRADISFPRTLAVILAMPVEDPHYKRIQLALRAILLRAHINNLTIYSVAHKGEISVCIGSKFFDETPQRRRTYNKALTELVGDSLIRLKDDKDSCITGFELTARGSAEAANLVREYRNSMQFRSLSYPQVKQGDGVFRSRN